MHALDNLIFRKWKTVWMDWHLLFRESWKVSRERTQQIWFKDMVEKLPTQWARKRVLLSWDGILGRVNFPRYIVMYSSKEGKKNCEHKHSSCTFFPKFLKQIWVRLTVKTPGKLATNLQNEHNSLICKSVEETNMNWKIYYGRNLTFSFCCWLLKRVFFFHEHKLIFLAVEFIKFFLVRRPF